MVAGVMGSPSDHATSIGTASPKSDDDLGVFELECCVSPIHRAGERMQVFRTRRRSSARSGVLEYGTGRRNKSNLTPTEGALVKTSTWILIAGVVLLFVPIPPFGLIGGIILLGIGIALKLFTDI